MDTMTNCKEARVLGLDEIAEKDGKTMWLQLRNRPAVVPVVFDHETLDQFDHPIMTFSGKQVTRDDDIYMLRPGLFGDTWIMYDRKPSAAKRREF